MVFSSEIFLFLFLPSFLAAYYLTPTHLRSYTIVIGSYLFYAWWRVDFLGLLFATTVWVYVFARLIERNLESPRARWHLTVGIGGCLLVLAVFKYLNFFVDSIATLLGTTPEALGFHWRLILPIGISFYIFQSVSYLIDVYRRDTPATCSFIDLAAFKALFPQLIAGPILRFRDLADQFRYREHSLEKFADGTALFVVGLAKKVLIADSIAPLANAVFAADAPTADEAWLGAIAYMLQLYFDFSGYSNMACGLGLMIGFQFVRNFDAPYISRSITEFWRRWHISLSTWLRDYLYIPLGGSRLGGVRTYVNLLIVMMLGGLWHGANWTFVVWGTWHGSLLAVERATGWDRRAACYWYALPLTLLLVLIGWVAFRSDDMSRAFALYAGMLGFNGWGISPAMAISFTREATATMAIAAVLVCIEPRLRDGLQGDASWTIPSDGSVAARQSLVTPLAMLLLATVTVLKLADGTYSPFLYFQF
ncbi:unnamed protein product [Ciceribacter sp. T2.26MG-112.2]|uniref:MBOAT family O-acyltransferase n=1 Tax=Ciceribacter sp. T2.26MG-112.2 TaxID=3137154 RepID=UPI000E12AD8C|nr:MBOAT family protein [Ciceribacter naphthalenivorans]SSC71361.1 unnamed protein product [Ciceribacter naphthalenivorans]